MRTGLIGAGGISKSHADVFAELNIEFAAVADIDLAKCEMFEKEYGVKSYTDYKQMIKNEALDAVVITLPHGLHKEAAVFCAGNGVNVLLEKPMANTVSECEEIIKAANENGIKLMIGHPQRYIAENIEAKRIVKSGQLGELACITEVRNVRYFSADRPKWFFSKELAGGGIVMNYGAHTFDKLIWMIDSEVKEVFGNTAQLLQNIEVEGNAQIFAEFENGVTANISYCGYNVFPLYETMFYFTNGVMKLCTGSSIWIGTEGKALEQIKDYKKENCFTLMWKDFIEMIEKGVKPELDGHYGLEIIKLIEQVYKTHLR